MLATSVTVSWERTLEDKESSKAAVNRSGCWNLLSDINSLIFSSAKLVSPSSCQIES